MQCPRCDYTEGFIRCGIGEFEQELLLYEGGEDPVLEAKVVTHTLEVTAVICSKCEYRGREEEFTP